MTEIFSPIAYPIEDTPAVAGVSRTRIFKAVRNKELTIRKAGRSSIVTHDDLMAWINSLPIKGKPLVGPAV
jgi:hypothetical protein